MTGRESDAVELYLQRAAGRLASYWVQHSPVPAGYVLWALPSGCSWSSVLVAASMFVVATMFVVASIFVVALLVSLLLHTVSFPLLKREAIF